LVFGCWSRLLYACLQAGEGEWAEDGWMGLILALLAGWACV
jgi:hypothetical protein